MSNNYFQFKQFTVYQDQCAMKVCTDSCLFGAWIEIENNVNSILDIGTGTGLLSLMLAQRSEAEIHAVEIDRNAYTQAVQNTAGSPWKDKISVDHADIRNLTVSKKYDLIVCNPPFYENNIHSSLHEEKIAKHSIHLSLNELVTAISNHLNENGKFAILLPWGRKEEFEKTAMQYGYYAVRSISIRQTPDHNFFRYAAEFTKNKEEKFPASEITIKNEQGDYSGDAVNLLKPYYLHL